MRPMTFRKDYDEYEFCTSTGMIEDVRSEYDELLENALELLKEWSEEYDHIVTASSGGIDSVAVVELAYQAGIDEVVCVQTACAYPQHQQYIQDRAEFRDLDLNVVYLDWWNPQWLSENPQMLFATGGRPLTKFRWMRQQSHIRGYVENNDVDMLLLGRVHEQNFVPGDTGPLGSHMAGYPIGRWRTPEITKYLEDRGVPISPIYRVPHSHGSGDCPWSFPVRWHGDQFVPIEECWWIARSYLPDVMWNEILDYFPNADAMADDFSCPSTDSEYPTEWCENDITPGTVDHSGWHDIGAVVTGDSPDASDFDTDSIPDEDETIEEARSDG